MGLTSVRLNIMTIIFIAGIYGDFRISWLSQKSIWAVEVTMTSYIYHSNLRDHERVRIEDCVKSKNNLISIILTVIKWNVIPWYHKKWNGAVVLTGCFLIWHYLQSDPFNMLSYSFGLGLRCFEWTFKTMIAMVVSNEFFNMMEHLEFWPVLI